MPNAPGVRLRTADGLEYLILFKKTSGSTRDTIAELLAVVYFGEERVWCGGVGIGSAAVLGVSSHFSSDDPWQVSQEYWHRILVRLALPVIQRNLMSNTLDDDFIAIDGDVIEDYFANYGAHNRPCDFFDNTQQMASHCSLAQDRGVDVQVGRAFCRDCELPEPFARCANLAVIDAVDTSSHGGNGFRFRFGCKEGREEFTSPEECISKPCFEHMTVEAPRSVVSDVIIRVFEQHLGFVEMKLRTDYPDAFGELCAAFEHLSDRSEPEELAQAAASCRRVLSDLADRLYPASDEVRNGRKLDESKYVNRLWAYAEAKMESSTNAALVRAGLVHLGGRIDAVNKLACKGDHDDWTVEEAYRCAVQTLLVISDLLAL